MSLERSLSIARHISKPFVSLPRTALVAPGRNIAAAHARIAFVQWRAGRNDIDRKQTEILGMQVSFFEWRTLHLLFDEIFLNLSYAFDPGHQSPRIIDAGGNIGMATLWFSLKFPNARITTVEPDPVTFELLKANIADNHLDRVTPLQVALADTAGSIEFFVDPDKPGSLTNSADVLRMSGNPVTVPAMRLSDLVDGPVDLLKLDVEGAELEIVGEMASSGALSDVLAIAMEYHHHIDPNVDRLSEMLGMLERNGFAYKISASPIPAPLDQLSSTGFQDVSILATRR
jgi:FkbM family methyltransferase